MQITIKHGIESVTKSYASSPTFGQVKSDESVRAVLGNGDNTRALVYGVEQPDNNLVPDGTTVVLETRANSKQV